jgi:hypothetical protein
MFAGPAAALGRIAKQMSDQKLDQPIMPQPQPKQLCPHSHLPIDLLKKIGKAVEKVGTETVETALTIALSNLGAFSED